MSEGLRKQLEFPSSLIQAQAVRSLVAAVLKEKGLNEKIAQSSNQSPALELLWEKCCSDSVLVRSACCDALVLLVEQNHADLQYVLNSILNLIPSASNVQGLIKVIGKLLQIQSLQHLQDGKAVGCPYTIRNPPHPYVTILENRPDCWPVLLREIGDYIQQCIKKMEPAYVAMLTPFLRYVYCEPLHLPEHAEFRQNLLRVLVPHCQEKGEESEPSSVAQCVIRSLFDLIPHLQVVTVTQVVELGLFVKELSSNLLKHAKFWKTELCQLSLQLLCACELNLRITGEFSALIDLIENHLEVCSEDFPSEQMITGLALLLLKAPATQQIKILNLAFKIITSSEMPVLPAAAPILVLPLLQILSCTALMEALSDSQIRETNQHLASTLLQTVQGHTFSQKEDTIKLPFPICSWYSTLLITTDALHRLNEDQSAACKWLFSVHSALPLNESIPEHVPLLLSYLIVREEGEGLEVALRTVAELAKADPSQVPNLIPVLMFKLGKLSDPVLSCAVLYALPSLGTHKFCVPQLLQALQVLGSASKLRPVVLRLMTSLWIKQDRVYPELQKLMAMLDKSSVVFGKEEQWEQILAKAACIRDICRERPYQHGGDMLAAITETLSQCTKNDQATPAAFVLQGLLELCRAEVVDIRSTWNALSPKLNCDSRPIVVKALTELFALVPVLSVKTEEYEKFKDQVVIILWSYTLNKDPLIASCGYRALSNFPEGVHTILHLPEQARPPVKTPDSEEEINEDEEKEEDLSIPGASYIKLLGLTPPAVLPALEVFLTSLVRQEMVEMPRGVYHSALRGAASRSDLGKTVAGIPGFILKTYEKNKQPGLKPGLAAGLLLCYDLPIQTDRDGRPINRFLVSRGRSFQQMLAALIHEVNIQPSEWHRSILLPQGWRGFMSRAYHAVLQKKVLWPLFHSCLSQYSDISGQKMNLFLMKSLDVLEGCSFDTSLEYNTGCILGVGLVLSLLSHSSQTESRVHVAATLEKLLCSLEDSSSQGRMLQEVLAYSVACVCVSAFSTGIIDANKAEEIMNNLRLMTEKSQQTPGFALSLGITVHGLSACGHGKAEDFYFRLLGAWIKILLTEGCPTMQRLAAVNGLVALVGSESSLIQLKSESGQSPQQQSRLNEVIRAITQVITFSGAVGLQSNASCLVGHLHLANLSLGQTRTSVPPDFGYLSERSVIRAAVDYLIEAGRKGPEHLHPKLVNVVLGPLASVGSSFQYPPVNWGAILSPLMRLNFGNTVLFIMSSIRFFYYLIPHLKTRAYLYKSVSVWMKHVPDDKLQSFVEVLGVQHLTASSRQQSPDLCVAVLEGLEQAMKLPNPTQFCWGVLRSTTERIFMLLPDEVQDDEVELYVRIATCLSEMEDTEIDRITRVTKANLVKTGFTMAYLVSQGRVPLLGLNDVIAAAIGSCHQEAVSSLLVRSFYQSRLAASPNTGVLKRMEWLLELMGHIRNVAYGSTPVENGDVKQATDFLLQLFCAAVVSWADHSLPLLLGIGAKWLPWKEDNAVPSSPQARFGNSSADEQLALQCSKGLPYSIQLLLAKEPWKGQTHKFIDWFFSILECPKQGLSERSIRTVKGALLALRYLPEFKKKVVWTRAYGW
nr:PREDICTED: focadhesin [Lepisosteus oculatus]